MAMFVSLNNTLLLVFPPQFCASLGDFYFRLCLSENLHPQYSLAGYKILGWKSFSFRILKLLLHCFLLSSITVLKSDVPLKCSPISFQKILEWSLISLNIILMGLAVEIFLTLLFRILCLNLGNFKEMFPHMSLPPPPELWILFFWDSC